MFTFGGVASAHAADPVWHLLIEPKFMRYEAAWPVAGSENTVLVPARVVDGEVTPLKRADFSALNVNRKTIEESAPAAAEKVLARLTPRFERGENKVILYAVIESEDPLTASAVLAPGFAAKFAESLGPDLLIAIPNRYRVFVFSKSDEQFLRLADLVVAEYQSAAYPVSREVFTLKKGRLFAVGAYR